MSSSADRGPYRAALEENGPDVRIEPLSRWQRRYRCGHRGPRRFRLFIEGVDRGPKKRYYRDKPFCPDCLEKLAIRCAACPRTILPGESVTAFRADKDRKPWAVFLEKEIVIGCMSCGGGILGYAGTWNGKSVDSPFVPR